MKAMTLGLVVFLVAIGSATFIESTHGIQAAKILIYNAVWFEILLFFLGLNLVSNIFKHRMYQREKIAVLSFHLAFLVILLGSAVTRFVSFEGIMVIQEGKSSNFIYTSDPHVLMQVSEQKTDTSKNIAFKAFLSDYTNDFGNDFHEELTFQKQNHFN